MNRDSNSHISKSDPKKQKNACDWKTLLYLHFNVSILPRSISIDIFVIKNRIQKVTLHQTTLELSDKK